MQVFNVNEPMIFGVPIVMNTPFLIPMVLSPVLSMGLTLFLTKIIPVSLNPMAALGMPWTVPWPIVGFFAGGLPLFGIIMAVVVLNIVLYWPFFKIADNKAFEMEALEIVELEMAEQAK